MYPRRRFTLALPNGRSLNLGDRTLVMGVLNVTPDSFSDGGSFDGPEAAVDAGVAMAAAGADIIDVGGESTRPGAVPVAAGLERDRVVPVIQALAGRVDVPISVDTSKAEVADAALTAGATIVNDISGLRYDPALAAMAAQRGAAVVVMHMRGRPSDMYREATYHDVVAEVLDELRESIAFATKAGVQRDRIVVDPGLGFAKDAAQSLEALAGTGELAELGMPVLVGPSRKSFLTRTLGSRTEPRDRDWATAAAVTAAILSGAHIVRVHAVREMVQVARTADEIRRYYRSRES